MFGFILEKDKFPIYRKSKLSPRGDGPFQKLKKNNNNAYQLYLPDEYDVHTTFNVMDLIPFVGSNDEEVDATKSEVKSFSRGRG